MILLDSWWKILNTSRWAINIHKPKTWWIFIELHLALSTIQLGPSSNARHSDLVRSEKLTKKDVHWEVRRSWLAPYFEGIMKGFWRDFRYEFILAPNCSLPTSSQQNGEPLKSIWAIGLLLAHVVGVTAATWALSALDNVTVRRGSVKRSTLLGSLVNLLQFNVMFVFLQFCSKFSLGRFSQSCIPCRFSQKNLAKYLQKLPTFPCLMDLAVHVPHHRSFCHPTSGGPSGSWRLLYAATFLWKSMGSFLSRQSGSMFASEFSKNFRKQLGHQNIHESMRGVSLKRPPKKKTWPPWPLAYLPAT